MIKRIDILGMHVDNYTVRESILQLDTYMGSTVLNIIGTVTIKQLILAGENDKVREYLAQLDLSVLADGEILAETGNASAQRIREIKDKDFMYELLKRVVRNQKRVFLIAMTRDEVEHMQKFFTEVNPRFQVEGNYAMEECSGDEESVVNEINGTTPDIIISAMTSPNEEEFILAHKDKINASVWYGIGQEYDRKTGGIHIKDTVKRLALRGRLRRTVSKYQNENKERK